MLQDEASSLWPIEDSFYSIPPFSLNQSEPNFWDLPPDSQGESLLGGYSNLEQNSLEDFFDFSQLLPLEPLPFFESAQDLVYCNQISFGQNSQDDFFDFPQFSPLEPSSLFEDGQGYSNHENELNIPNIPMAYSPLLQSFDEQRPPEENPTKFHSNSTSTSSWESPTNNVSPIIFSSNPAYQSWKDSNLVSQPISQVMPLTQSCTQTTAFAAPSTAYPVLMSLLSARESPHSRGNALRSSKMTDFPEKESSLESLVEKIPKVEVRFLNEKINEAKSEIILEKIKAATLSKQAKTKKKNLKAKQYCRKCTAHGSKKQRNREYRCPYDYCPCFQCVLINESRS